MNLQEIIINLILAIKLDSIIKYNNNHNDSGRLRMKQAFRYVEYLVLNADHFIFKNIYIYRFGLNYLLT